ncbi:MAG TPA: M48 family metallopeptidase [Thermoanaerobaculia bacterium]|nr:M48 family metallopeptidase [Thermoanaerobaculia bacterium]
MRQRARLAAWGIAALLWMGNALPAQEPAPAAGAFDAEAATESYLARMSTEARERSDAYFEGGYWLQLWGFLYGLGVSWIFLGTGLSARMRDRAERVTRFKFVHTFLYAAQYIVGVALLSFPWTLYTDFVREHKYGLSTQTFGAWLTDQGKGLGVGLVLGGLALCALYAVLRKAPRTWWIWGAVVALLFLIVGVALGPVFIEPIFNKYTELTDPTLREPILSMARANGIPAEHVYVVDASRQTNRVSANVAGAFGTMRIALNDNLLHRTTKPGIEAVMGHEMGHYVLNHVYESILFFGVVLVAGFAFLRFAFDRALARWGGRWGVRGVADPAGLPLLSAIFAVYFFVLTPFLNTYIRTNEAEADVFGLNAARQPDGFAEVALQLSEYRKMSPGPVEEWIFFDHPSGRARIRMAMEWKAEHLQDSTYPAANSR